MITDTAFPPRQAPYRREAFECTGLGVFVATWTVHGLKRLAWSHDHEFVGNSGLIVDDAPVCEVGLPLESVFRGYIAGNFRAFDSVPIDGSDWSPFFAKVYQTCRDIPPGETLSYRQVATLAGSSGAARAVGQAMRTNSLPLVIPCHRVVGSSGKLHGYSGPGGLNTKQLLLDHERGERLLQFE